MTAAQLLKSNAKYNYTKLNPCNFEALTQFCDEFPTRQQPINHAFGEISQDLCANQSMDRLLAVMLALQNRGRYACSICFADNQQQVAIIVPTNTVNNTPTTLSNVFKSGLLILGY